jgi:hypothetical protein
LVLLKTHEITNQNLRVTVSSGPKFGKTTLQSSLWVSLF